VDNVAGGAGNDTINGTAKTLTALDNISGGDGTDTLNVVDADALLGAGLAAAVTVSGVETLNVTSSGKVGTMSAAATSNSISITFTDTVNTKSGAVTITPIGQTAALSAQTYTATAADQSGANFAAAAAAELTALYQSAGYAVTATGSAPTSANTVDIKAGAATSATGTTTVTIIGAVGVTLPTPVFSAITDNSASPSVSVTAATTAASAAVFDTSGWTSVSNTAVSSVGGAFVSAGSANALTITNTSGGGVQMSGGASQTATTTGAITSYGSAGAVTLTNSSQSSGLISVDGGTNVTITTTATTGAVTVGANGAGVYTSGTAASGIAPTGAVVISQRVSGSSTANRTGGLVTVKGGTTVDITETASPSTPSLTSMTGYTVTLGGAAVTGGLATSAVTVTQSAPQAKADFVAAVAPAYQSMSVKFAALAAGQSVTIEGLTFTAGALGATAEQVAKAFSGLSYGALASAAGTAVGTFTGNLSVSGGNDYFFSGTASGDTVVFTSPLADAASDFVSSTTGATPLVVTEVSRYRAEVVAEGRGGIANGAVTVTDVNYAAANNSTKVGTIKTVTANNFSSLTVSDNALSTLNITGGQGAVTIKNGSSLLPAELTTTLAVNVGGQRGGALQETLEDATTLSGVYKTLNVTTSSASYFSDVKMSGVKTLNVAGTSALGLDTAANLGALEKITVSGSAGLSDYTSATRTKAGDVVYTAATLGLSGLTTLKTVDTTATTGTVRTSIDAAAVTYSGGAGVDRVTAAGVTVAGDTTTTVSKGISTGAGNDIVTLTSSAGTGALAISASINAGDGTDTLSMSTRDAVTVATAVSGLTSAVFKSYVTGFETLSVSDATIAADTTIALAALGFGSSVSLASAVSASKKLTLDNFANGGTLTFAASQSNAGSEVALTNAIAFAATAANTAASYVGNSVNLVLASNSYFTYDGNNNNALVSLQDNRDAGTVTLTNVGTVNITSSDTGADYYGYVGDNTITLNNAKAHTVNVTGNANLALSLSNTTLPVMIDGSSMTGDLTVTANATLTGATVKGGEGYDALTASTGNAADTLIGGGGKDTLTSNAGASSLTGGAGSDTFFVGTVSAAKTIYTTITDASAGDRLKLIDVGGATETFRAAKIDLSSLGASATLDAAVNLAIKGSAAGEIRWFQFGGDTFVIEAAAARSATDNFADGSDLIVKLSGAIDLGLAGFSASSQTLVFG
jgi:S-layer protein